MRLLLLVLLLPATAMAGAWTREGGAVYSKAGVDLYASPNFVDPTTGEEQDSRYVGISPSLYAEIGLLPVHPLQFSLSLPLAIGINDFADEDRFVQGRAKATSLRGGDARLGLQVSLLPPKARAAVQLNLGATVKVPLYANDEVGARFSTWSSVFPKPGDGQLDVTAWLSAGASLRGAPAWLEGGLGYRHRSEVFVGSESELVYVDGLPFWLTFGVDLDPVLVMAQVAGNKNFVADEISREGVSVVGAVYIRLGRGFAFEARFGGEPWVGQASQGILGGAGISWQGAIPGER